MVSSRTPAPGPYRPWTNWRWNRSGRGYSDRPYHPGGAPWKSGWRSQSSSLGTEAGDGLVGGTSVLALPKGEAARCRALAPAGCQVGAPGRGDDVRGAAHSPANRPETEEVGENGRPVSDRLWSKLDHPPAGPGYDGNHPSPIRSAGRPSA